MQVSITVAVVFRHVPFDIRGGGLEFLSGPRIFFRTKSEQDYFFRRPFGPYYFFVTESYIYDKKILL